MAARRTKTDAQATRNALLDAAERLFDEKGVSRTSLQDIAADAGATRGAIYWHFKDKADLFNAMMERTTEPLDELARRTTDAHQAPDMRRYVEDMVRVLQRIASDDALCRVLRIATYRIEYVEELGAVQARHLQVHRQWLEHNRAALERAFAASTCQAQVPPDTAALGLQVLIEGLLHSWLLDPTAFDLVQAGRCTIATYLRGLGIDLTQRPAPG
ncbi:MAG TPA: TetR family transcriptional regulator [Comamonadaceae bacterium]|nr:TetR family transcriptional regulator [Comamonadaceae bacterium]